MPTPRPSMKKLDFTEKLIQSGKRENTDALLKRLKTLHLKLKDLEQDQTDVKSLDHVRAPLVSPLIMHHKDRGVKAYATCCLADLLRLYAPDAPFTPEELRDIFQFMSTQLVTNLKAAPTTVKPLQPSRGRSNTDAQIPLASQRITDVPYYTEYYYLLENLATIRSVVLALDVPDADDIVTSFFTGFVDVVRPDMSKTLVRHLRDILVALIEEASPIPSGVMDCIIAQFEAQADTPNTTAFHLVQDVCNRTSTKLTRAVYAHFSAIQLEHGRSKDASSDDIQTLAESHKLIITIYRHCPGILVNFISQLEENLRAADEVPLRQLSTRTLGTMFGMRPMVGNTIADLARAYPAAWRAWLGRKVDKALPVRLAWVESARGILVTQPDLRGEMEAELADRIHDSEEKIRTAICRVFGSLDYDTALHHISEDTLRAVGGRTSDKKAAVRSEAAQTLAKLWNLAYASIEANDPDAVQQFAWIPEALLSGIMRRDATAESRAQMTTIFKSSILPLPAVDQIDEQAWVDRLLVVHSHLDEGGDKALERLSGLKGYSRGNSPYRAFIDFCEENNGGIIDGDAKVVRARLDYVSNAIAHLLSPDPGKARKDLDAFAAANDPRLYKLVKGCVDPQSDLRTIIKARNELLRRIEQSHTDILDTMTLFIDHAAWNILNHSAISPLVKRMQRSEGPRGDALSRSAFQLFALMAKECPPMLKSHVPELVIVMSDKKNALLSEAALRGLACVCKADPESASDDKRAAERAYAKALEGTPKQAKFATRYLAYSKSSEMCTELLDAVLAKLPKTNDDRLLSYLQVLSEMALSSPQVFAEKADEVMEFVHDDVLQRESPEQEEGEWVPEEELLAVDRAKLLALRIVAHRALAYARQEGGVTYARRAFDVFRPIIEEQPDEENGETRAYHHRVLRAALCILKLANAKAFDKAIPWDLFESVGAVLIQRVGQVRYKLLLKLGEILPSQRLMPRWNMLPVLVANDPENEHVQLGASVMMQTVRGAAALPTEQRIDRTELQLSRLLLAVSHHSDLEDTAESIKNCARYIEMFLDCVASRDNISLLLMIAAKIKTVKDSTQDDSSALYRLTELAQIIIKQRAAYHSWPLSSYPGNIRLPKEGFHNLHNPEEAREVVRRRYLSEQLAEKATKSLGKRGGVASNTMRKAGTNGAAQTQVQKGHQRSSESPKKRARKSGGRKAGAKKRGGKRDETSDEESDEDEEDEEDEEEQEEEEEEGDEGGAEEGVVGRGGRRGAKTKANKAVTKRKRVKRVKKSSEVDEAASDLSEVDE